MSDPIKHECGIAVVRLLKPLEYYEHKYGTPLYGFNQLFLLMEKQHNRGQDGAGIGCVKLGVPAGESFMARDRALGSAALTEMFSRQLADYEDKVRSGRIIPEIPATVKQNFNFGGELLIGHLRYGTSGNYDLSTCHPFARKSIWPTRNLMIAGNFSITNPGDLNEALINRGAHPVLSTDTQSLLEELGFWLDDAHTTIFRELRDAGVPGREMPDIISRRIDLAEVIRKASHRWDGGFTLCGATGNGDMFAMRDPNGIRPCFILRTDEVVAVASERAALMTIFNAAEEQVEELAPGTAMIVQSYGDIRFEKIFEPGVKTHCTFERLYFSRGNDPSIYEERKALGAALVPQILKEIDNDLAHTVFSFIPNTAETSYYGMMAELRVNRRREVRDELLAAVKSGNVDEALVEKLIMGNWPRGEKVAHKDIKLRTFISQEKTRNRLASHVYDISYGVVKEGENLVIIDDSIVRGTTLRESILKILSRPNPKKIIVCSSAPQVRYPDCYGIDMSELGKFLAFQAAIHLCTQNGKGDLLREVYQDCLKELEKPEPAMVNHVGRIYDQFTEEEIARKCAELVYPDCEWKGELVLVFQTLENLLKSCPGSAGDWYFSGNYPTPGGFRALNRAYVNFYENRSSRSY